MTATERDRLIALETVVSEMDKKLDKVIADHESRIRCLESRPGKRLNTIITSIISSIVGAVIGAFVAVFTKR